MPYKNYMAQHVKQYIPKPHQQWSQREEEWYGSIGDLDMRSAMESLERAFNIVCDSDNIYERPLSRRNDARHKGGMVPYQDSDRSDSAWLLHNF